MGSKKVMVVTGFVPNAFPARHLSEQQCRDYGNRLKSAVDGRVCAFDQDWTLQKCWAYKLLEENPNLMPSDINPPTDRYADPQHAAISNIILLQIYEWMRLAAEMNPDVDVFAWVEYTVLKQRNVTEQIITNFANTLEIKYYEQISLPGVWDKRLIDDKHAHWRFAGSAWVCPKQHVEMSLMQLKQLQRLELK